TPDPIKTVGFIFIWAGLIISLLPLHRLLRRENSAQQ
ncbi:MAG: EamA family transporter RarD, partial [Aeromonas sp.]